MGRPPSCRVDHERWPQESRGRYGANWHGNTAFDQRRRINVILKACELAMFGSRLRPDLSKPIWTHFRCGWPRYRVAAVKSGRLGPGHFVPP